jgi:hypothetical protein|tara:strand:+ start:357 stop:554 length:198 start_codon:yes stop_codon:yes gene_type:complete
MIQNNFSVQIYDQESDNKLDILYINNIIKLDDNNENFTKIFEEELLDEELKFEGYNISEIYYSIL